MRILTALAFLFFLTPLASADVIPIPEGATGLEFTFGEPTLPPVPPVVTPPDPPTALVYPATRPSWCETANFCISLADSEAYRTTYILMRRYPKEPRYDFKFQPGVHTVRISTPVGMKAPVTIDGYGATQDCVHSVIKGSDKISAPHGFEGQGCLVSLSPDTTVSGLTIIGGVGVGRGADSIGDTGFRCIRVHGKISVKDATLQQCNHGVQGDGQYDWTLDNVTMTDCSHRGSGQSHCIYSSSVVDSMSTLTIINSRLGSYGGHVIKSGHTTTIVTNTDLIEGVRAGGDTGYAFHSTSNGDVELTDVRVVQHKINVGAGGSAKGNVGIFGVGPKLIRCRGPGTWTLKNVAIVDHMAWKYARFTHVAGHMRVICPLPTTFVDAGGNTLVKINLDDETAATVDLFKQDGSFK